MTINLKDVFDDYPNPLYIVHPIAVNGTTEDFQYEYVNKAFSKLLGKEQDQLIGHRYREFYGPGEPKWLETFSDAAAGHRHFFINEISTKINKRMYTEVFHVDPDMCGCIIHDEHSLVEELDPTEHEMLKNRAYCDYLTGFYNRFYLNERQSEFTSMENVGITYLDINNLKKTNDTMGHAAGDRLIRKVGSMIIELYPKSTVFRLGGDEFVIITEGYTKQGFLRLAETAGKAFEKDHLAAIGYRYFDHIRNLKKCIDECDCLMYEQKRRMKA
jgi:diguanylate cyclase (GGDEF)-like protein